MEDETTLDLRVMALMTKYKTLLNFFDCTKATPWNLRLNDYQFGIARYMYSLIEKREHDIEELVEALRRYLALANLHTDEDILESSREWAETLYNISQADLEQFAKSADQRDALTEEGNLGNLLTSLWKLASNLDAGYQRYVGVYIIYFIMSVFGIDAALGERLEPHRKTAERLLQRRVVKRDKEITFWPWSSPKELLPKAITVASLAEDTDEERTYRKQAQDTDTPVTLLQFFASHHNPRVREAACQNPKLVTEMVIALANDREAPVRKCAARHPALPQGYRKLMRLAGSNEDFTDFAPYDKALDSDQLERLSRDGYWGRLLAAWHPNTSPKTLRCLSRNMSLEARILVAANPSMPVDVLEWLAGDLFSEVRSVIARHPFMPNDRFQLLTRLGSDPQLKDFSEPDLSLTEAEFLSALDAHSFGPWADVLVARHPNVTSSVLARVPLSSSEVAKLLLEHPATPTSRLSAVVSFLALNTEPDVRQEAAEHPNMPKVYLQLLERAGSSPNLMSFAPYDPSLTPEELMQLFSTGERLSELPKDDSFWWARILLAKHPSTPVDMLRALVNDDSTGFHETTEPTWGIMWNEISPMDQVACNPNAPVELLRQLAKTSSNSIRRSVARHPYTPADVLQDLALDMSELVREAVGSRD